MIGGSIVLAVFLRRWIDRRRDDGARAHWPAKGPMLEQTVSGWLIPVLVAAVAVLILTRRSDARLSWRQRISESGKLPLVTAEG